MIDFDSKARRVLDEYHQRIEDERLQMQILSHEEGFKKRDQFLLPVGKSVGIFLNTLVKESSAQSILEIGTSYGYSTLWLAEAAKETGGKVISLEIDPNKASYAKEKLEKADLIDFVDMRIGDALQSIHEANEIFDFVLVDIWKELYVPSFESFFPKLKKGAYIVADNMIFPPAHQKETAAYRKAIDQTNSFDSVLLPIGSGIEISHLK